jgi:RNA polymerase sigma factor (sigma-70 family)
MKVAVTAKLKNGILWEAVKKMGSQSSLAKHLGIGPSVLGQWLHFNGCPAFNLAAHRDLYAGIELKLMELTGHTLDEIFPREIRNRSFLAKQKKIDAMVDMPVERLIGMGAVPQLPPAPDDLLFQQDQQAVIGHVLSNLKPRYQDVIKMRFGLAPYEGESTVVEVAEKIGVSPTRVQQIEAKALRMLRHPANSRPLREIRTK